MFMIIESRICDWWCQLAKVSVRFTGSGSATGVHGSHQVVGFREFKGLTQSDVQRSCHAQLSVVLAERSGSFNDWAIGDSNHSSTLWKLELRKVSRARFHWTSDCMTPNKWQGQVVAANVVLAPFLFHAQRTKGVAKTCVQTPLAASYPRRTSLHVRGSLCISIPSSFCFFLRTPILLNSPHKGKDAS